MNHGSILAILRQLSESAPSISDAELLTRFSLHRDEDAFAELVRRHGRLVWAVCNHLVGPDADDAFQATFLVLLRNARKIRKTDNLSSWLHGVAFRVCSKSRQSAKRRTVREAAVAVNDSNGSVVPDSAWDRALAAVHEEVVKLPESQRVPFVLCILEGTSVTDAAKQLGWKLGTLSGRLTRAKDAILARLHARGVSAATLAAMTCTSETAPAAAIANATTLMHGGLTVSVSILHLSQGVIGMSVYHAKMLAAGVLLAIGLGISGGSGWIANADAQTGLPAAEAQGRQTPEEKVKQLEAQLQQAKKELEDSARKKEKNFAEIFGDKMPQHAMTVQSTDRWDYGFVKVLKVDLRTFAAYLQYQERDGWHYLGQTNLQDNGRDESYWTFRRGKSQTPSSRPVIVPYSPFGASFTPSADPLTPPPTTPVPGLPRYATPGNGPAADPANPGEAAPSTPTPARTPPPPAEAPPELPPPFNP